MVVELVLTGVVLAVHTLIAAVMTRYFRIRMHTRWGALLYTFLLVPVVLVVTTLAFSGALGIGVYLGSATNALAVMVGMPLVLGFTVDVLYVPAPEEYDLPDTQ
ncbi:MAG: hypothetical protein ABEJ61_04625 [Haloferacaceae archaeon]